MPDNQAAPASSSSGGQKEQNTTSSPPKPGDEVPAGGLDPAQVFASPPSPSTPPSSTGPGGRQQDGGSGGKPPVKDSGKPPPPAGVAIDAARLKEEGYDDEDIRVLGVVGDYRFGSISAGLTTENIAVPAHPETRFDEKEFLMLLAGSISLMRDEKWRIIQAIPKLSQFQIDELGKILTEERRKFAALSPKHLLQLKKLEQKHSDDWKDLQSLMVQEKAKEEESAQADEIRKKLGL